MTLSLTEDGPDDDFDPDTNLYVIDSKTGVRSLLAASIGDYHGMAIESSGQILLVRGEEVVRFNPVTATETVVSSSELPAKGSGPDFVAELFDVTVRSDGTIITSSSYADPPGALVVPSYWRVDPTTGDRALFPTVYSAPYWGLTGGFAFDANDKLVVASTFPFFGSVLSFDTNSGEHELISNTPEYSGMNSDLVGTGPDLFGMTGLTIGSDGRIYVSQSHSEIIGIDPTTGNREIVSSAEVGTGPALSEIRRMAIEADGTLLVGSEFGFVYRVDPQTGNRSLLVDPLLESVIALAVVPATVPEPSTFVLLSMGAVGLAFFVKRRQR